MYVSDGRLVLSATDLVRHLACRHLTQLDLHVAQGVLGRPTTEDEALEVLFRRGLEHERAVLDGFRRRRLTVAEVTVTGRGDEALRRAEADTLAAMSSGVDVVYQTALFDGSWRGHADFLLRNDQRPSAEWPWSYDIADTKLARRLKATAAVQMAVYAERLTALQGVPPATLTVIGGDGVHHVLRLRDCDSYTRRAAADLLEEIERSPVATWPERVGHCVQCRWSAACAGQRRAEDDLSLVHGMRRDHARLLRDGGIRTVVDLAATDPCLLPREIGEPSRVRLAQQARLQVQERRTGEPLYELLPFEVGRGLALLPEPSWGDVFFDMEGDPYVGESGLEYLFGLRHPDGSFFPYWAHDVAGEQAAFESVVDHVVDRWRRDPGMHVFHYAPYERSRLAMLAARHRTREEGVDRLLRGERLVDLYAVVRQGLRVSKESYSLKQLEAFYLPARERKAAAVADAASSIVAYERWLVTGDQAELDGIEEYIALDCRSTQLLRNWLEDRRDEWAAAGTPVPRPAHGDGAPSPQLAAAADRVTATCERLLAGLPADRAADSSAQAATRLLADLLDWHRREDRPAWWEYYARRAMSDDELVDDTGSLGELQWTGENEPFKRSALYRYEFPPQETKLGPGDAVVDPRTGSRVGEVHDIDVTVGSARLKRPAGVLDHPPSVIPVRPLDTTAHRGALLDVAGAVLAYGVDGQGPFRAARDLLLRHTLRGAQLADGQAVASGERPTAAVARLTSALDGGVLPVQGPPGTGKTCAGARAVLALVAAGRRVAVCATSHRAIGNLLDEIAAAATTAQVRPRMLQRAPAHRRCDSDRVALAADNAAVAAALSQDGVDVVGGTPWLFCRPEFRESFDVIVVDEASQMSLANAVAVATAARSVALLGDPQQLPQPVRGMHPQGAEASALGHLLGEHDTIPADLGVFLDTTWRMHPAVAGFVSEASYECRLLSHVSCREQRVDAPGALTGAGLWWVPVRHTANAAASTEEACAIAQLLTGLLRGTWTDVSGRRRNLSLDDVLVIAPYNAQLNRLRTHLPVGARIGTVDEFQGQEAPVVLYSLATSSAEDAPRGVDFLLSRNRMNVALSRARAIAAVVGSPELLRAPVHTLDQLRLVNLLCRFVEDSRLTSPAVVR